MRPIKKKTLTLTGLLFGAGVGVAFVMPMVPAMHRAREADDRSQCRIPSDDESAVRNDRRETGQDSPPKLSDSKP